MSMKSKLPKPERFLTWRVPVLCDGEKTPRLLVPRGDPFEHETAMDLLFDTEEQAIEALEDYDAEEEAKEAGWVLCESVVTPLRKV